MKKTVVKSFSSRRQMARGVERMAERGYRVVTQSGEIAAALSALGFKTTMY